MDSLSKVVKISFMCLLVLLFCYLSPKLECKFFEVVGPLSA